MLNFLGLGSKKTRLLTLERLQSIRSKNSLILFKYRVIEEERLDELSRITKFIFE